MASVIWAQELQGSIQKAASVMEKSAGEKGDDAEENRQRLQHIVQQFRSALHKVWMGDDVLFEIRYVTDHPENIDLI
jgi:ElaB/YqjD/DUF883 family membrane-anchored ribosome-binding protein